MAMFTAAALLLAAGCQQTLMPTPVAFYDENANPFVHLNESDERTDYDIFLFTDRKPSGMNTPATYYSNDRALGGRLATATVEIGGRMGWDELRLESLRERRHRNPTVTLVNLEELGVLMTNEPTNLADTMHAPGGAVHQSTGERFAAQVNTKLSKTQVKDIYIFVHGFNTRFEDNIGLAAELHHYLGREGIFMTYAWPSRDSLFAYEADKANARYSTLMFRRFLMFLSASTDANRIHILAHSAGAPIAVQALRQLRLIHSTEDVAAVKASCRIGQCVLVAGDMDLLEFQNAKLDGFHEIPERLTVYISTSDMALDFSSMIYKAARLGGPLAALSPQHLEKIRSEVDIDVIDVSAAEQKHGSWLGHSYFHDDPWVSSDLLLLLRFGVPATDRGLARGHSGAMWVFPKDYPTRVRAIAAALAEKTKAPEVGK